MKQRGTAVVRWLLLVTFIAGLVSFAGAGNTGMAEAQSDPRTRLVVSEDYRLSIELPLGWILSDELAGDGVWLFGENQEEVENRRVFWDENDLIEVDGNGGLVAMFRTEDIASSLDAAPVDNLEAIIEVLELEGVSETQSLSIGGWPAAYSVVNWGSQRGYVAYLALGEQVAFITSMGPQLSFEVNRDLLQAIVESVRVPANSGQTFGAEDDRVTLVLPAHWSIIDLPDTEDAFFAFGESDQEAKNRRIFWEENGNIEVEGLGGMVAFIPVGTLAGSDAAASEVVNLQSFITGLELETFEAPLPMQLSGYSGAVAVVQWGAQVGFLSMTRLDDNVALAFAATSPEQFENDRDVLFNVLRSLSFPGFDGQPSTPLIYSPDEALIIELPTGWHYVSRENGEYVEFLFGETLLELDAVVDNTRPVLGGGGLLLAPQPEEATVEALFDAYQPEFDFDESDVESDTIGDYSAMGLEFQTPETQGFWIVVDLEDRVLVAVLRASPDKWDVYQDVLEGIINSLDYLPPGN